MRVVIGLSGGMDSATLLGYYLAQGAEVHCCSFYYGSKHGPYESQAAEDIVEYYHGKDCRVGHEIFYVDDIFQGFSSALLRDGAEIPEGHYNSDTMKQTVVPGRNLIFASIMAGYAESINADILALGVHSGDHHIYPDCRPAFMHALREVVGASTDEKVLVEAPFLHEDKTTILKIGYGLNPVVPYHLTRTCYKAQYLACGKCGSCTERLEAFKNIGVTDPVSYAG